MIRRALVQISVLLCLGGAAAAQPVVRDPAPEPVPVDVALTDLRNAYAKTTADEMSVRFRARGGGDRTDTIIVRIQNSPDGPQRMLLDMGALRIYAAAGKLTAINTAAPGRYVEKAYTGVLSPASLADLIPPVPLPQLALAAGRGAFNSPTPYTPSVSWTSAQVESLVHVRSLVLNGSNPNSTVTVWANPDTGRLTRLTATVRKHDSESTVELAIHPVDPGDPASWAIKTEGRERAASLADLRSAAPRPAPEIAIGQPVPDLSFSKPDLTKWSLHAALADAVKEAAAGAPSPPVILVLFRSPPQADKAEAIARDAKAGLAALRTAATSTDLSRLAHPLTAAAVVIELADFNQDRWQEIARDWAAGSNPRVGADDLLWASSGAQTIDRLAPGAQAVVIVVAPDRNLRAAIRLDGRAGDTGGLLQDLNAALADRH
jgi:hypothetical protein